MLGFLNIMLVDAHTHVQDIKNFSLSKEVLPVVCGYSNTSNLRAIQVATRFSLPYALGIAPQTTLKEDISNLAEWTNLIRSKKPNAIGEIGLDFHWAKNENDAKKERGVFMKMLELAEEMGLPVVIHSRKATSEVIRTLKDLNFTNDIMFHFFSGTVEEAEQALGLGALLSFSPLHSSERRSIINRIELENILVETDAPFVCRSPLEVADAVRYVSEVKKLDYNIVAEQTAKNAMDFFRIVL